MAKFSNVNKTPTVNGGHIDTIYWLKQTLVDAGWVVKESSDGTTYNALG